MTKQKTTTMKRSFEATPAEFDQDTYEQQLLGLGISAREAKAVASKTAQAHRENTEKRARMKPGAQIGDLIGRMALSEPSNPTKRKLAREAVAQLAKTVAKETALAPKKAAAPKANKRAVIEKPILPVYDYRYGDLPARVRDLIEAHLAIEADDAKAAGSLGFMTRALAIATLPHRRLNEDRFSRKNGDFTLTMLTAHPEGLPYGTLPRLLLTWVCSEAVRTKEPVLSLGPTLASYLRELGLKNTGGKRGDITRLKQAMTTLFSAIISCRYEGRESWALQNVLLAERVEWWQPQGQEEAGEWSSKLVLSRPFFQECVDHPVPVNLVAMKALRHSPLALDIYVWLTHRMSYLSKRTMIPWISLSAQFGAGYARNEQGLRDFRRAFLRELKHVVTIYADAKLSATDNGLVLYPSPTHVPPKIIEQQGMLPF